MPYFLALVSGVPRMVEISTSSDTLPAIYEKSLVVVASSPSAGEILGPIFTGTPISLPEAKTYHSTELNVYLNGGRVQAGFDYTYVGSLPRTQIQFTFDLEPTDRLDFEIDREFSTLGLPDIYDESILVKSSGATGDNEINGPVSAGTSISLPGSQTYNSTELNVYLNGNRLETVFDYVYVGDAPRTQIQFTFDLEPEDRIDLEIDRSF